MGEHLVQQLGSRSGLTIEIQDLARTTVRAKSGVTTPKTQLWPDPGFPSSIQTWIQDLGPGFFCCGTFVTPEVFQAQFYLVTRTWHIVNPDLD